MNLTGINSSATLVIGTYDFQLTIELYRSVPFLRAEDKIKSHFWPSMHLTPLRCSSVE